MSLDNKILKEISNLNVVAIGGGTGISTMLRGIKKYFDNLTAIITVADDGGGSGMLREDLNMLPPGDVRNCIMALANTEPLMERLLSYRFDKGRLEGQSFGNLFLAAMCGISGGSFEEAVKQFSDVLAVKGRVLPVTTQNINLGARLSDGSVVLGESSIPSTVISKGAKIDELFLTPSNPNPVYDCIKSIYNADFIILGPGSLYTSIIPNLLVDGISEAIYKSDAKVVYVCNIMTQPGETDNFTAYDHIEAIKKHSKYDFIDYCIVNTEPLNDFLKAKYRLSHSFAITVDDYKFYKNNINLIGENLLDMAKDVVRHNYNVLADTLVKLFYEIKTKKRE
ncbi:MAG: YvcK family protein [Ruminococcaceae bacterium]|nr:YvcK family protein [Oscillospiraceae bacterium]